MSFRLRLLTVECYQTGGGNNKKKGEQMRLVDHVNNRRWWNKKVGEANAEQVALFAKGYQLTDPGAWAVVVTEGAEWIAASHVRDAVTMTRAAGAKAVWVSDGRSAQCVWRTSVSVANCQT